MGLFYKDRVCVNVLAGSLDNAKEIHKEGQGNVLVGVLSSNYENIDDAIIDMQKYNDVLDGDLSVGLGGGNPNQWKAVGTIAKAVKTKHYNQVFTAVSYTRANVGTDNAMINALVSPTGIPGLVRISTGPISKGAEKPADISIDTCIDMIKDMGGTAVKFFPMHGLKCRDELVEVAKACARKDFILEPTGGITLENFSEIVKICLENNVPKFIPHVYSSIIDKETGNTNIEMFKQLIKLMHELV